MTDDHRRVGGDTGSWSLSTLDTDDGATPNCSATSLSVTGSISGFLCCRRAELARSACFDHGDDCSCGHLVL